MTIEVYILIAIFVLLLLAWGEIAFNNLKGYIVSLVGLLALTDDEDVW